MSDDRNAGGFGWFTFGFLLGGLVGAALALAYAPQAGEETRELIRERSIELKGQAEELAGRARERMEELRQQAQMQIGQVRQQIEEGVQSARQYAEDVAERIRPEEGEEAAEEGEAEETA